MRLRHSGFIIACFLSFLYETYVNGGIMTSEQTIKTSEVRFDRRVSFFVRFLREAVQHMAALAGGFLSFINSFYGNAETEFSRIGFSNLSKAGWSWGSVSSIDFNRRTIWIADAHRGNGKRFLCERMKNWRRLRSWNRRFAPPQLRFIRNERRD
jgi:hypothetical protein